MTFHLPVLPPSLKPPAGGFAPKESFSPTQLANYGGADGCKRKWAWGSLFGIYQSKKSIATVLGSLIHGCLELYLKGGTVYDLVAPDGSLRLDKRTLEEVNTLDPKKIAELAEQAPKRALAGLHLIPNVKDPALEIVEVERWIAVDTRKIIGGIAPIKINGKIDLSIRRAGIWYLYDHKSTKGRAAQRGLPADPWAYMKTPEQLLKDPQSVFYALDIMLRHNLDALWCRWVYYLTDTKTHPQANHVDVELRRADVMQAAYEWLLVANDMRELVRRAIAGTLSPDDIEPNKNACSSYGGCPYHYKDGGPCMPDGAVGLGELISLAGDKPGKENKDMSLESMLAQTQAAISGGQPPLVPQSPLLPPEAHLHIVPPVAAAPVPARAALPPGWEYGPNGHPRAVAPLGFRYTENGEHFEPIPPVVVAPAPVVVPPAAAAPAAPPPIPQVPESTEESKGRKGRPKGSTNKPKGEEDAFDRLVAMAKAGDPVICSLTVGQLKAICEVIEAA